MACYRLEEIVPCASGSGKMDNAIDMTYIITMEGAERAKTIMQRLQKAKLTSKALIQYNSGYNCEGKGLGRKVPQADLTHALVTVFQHASEKGYDNILVLEDDFIFNRKFYDNDDIARICEFITTTKYDVYNLGPHSLISYPVSWYHRRALWSRLTHAMIYNKSSFRPYTRYAKQMKYDVPCDKIQDTLGLAVYFYHKPISYQLLGDTENRRTSGGHSPAWFTNMLGLSEEPTTFHALYGTLYYLPEFVLLVLVIIIIIYIINGT